MAELGLSSVRFGYDGPPLLDGVDLQIERGERIGLLGRNGQGKSTLLRVMLGEIELDAGEVTRRQGLRVAALPQEVPVDFDGTVEDQLRSVLTAAQLRASWEADKRVEQAVSELGLDPAAEAASLSAGMKRRLLLAKALVVEPDVLLLDEPTNHLDVPAIVRLEDRLLRREGSLVFVTHDRAFLRRVATRILDLDGGALRSFDCGYEEYLVRRAAVLEADAKQQAAFDKKLAQEEAWIRQGIQARRTRNMGRVRALEKMREQRQARRDRVGQVKTGVHAAERSGRVVVRAKHISFAYGDKPVIRDFSIEVHSGDRIGMIGANGAGKTTLLSLLFGDLEPDSGEVTHGTRLQVARFDQLATGLDLDKSVIENVCADGETITIAGKPRHVLGYLSDFLFTPEQARSPVSRLSGGERNRVQLAKLLAQPSNVLLLDEPTNDLDIETLELLEELLIEFPGTILLVSHDREFVDNVVTSNLVFGSDGSITEHVAGERSWELVTAAPPKPAKDKKPDKKPSAPTAPPKRERRLSYKEQKELEALPARIEALETEQARLGEEMARPEFFKRPGAEIAEVTARAKQLEAEIAQAYARWDELDAVG